MRAAESRTLTAGSAFNEPVWATVLLDRRLSQATMIGIKDSDRYNFANWRDAPGP